MPLTVPAHQAVVLPIKIRWPAYTDATAMCIGAAAPDLGYAVVGSESHRLVGVVLFAVPFTLIACALLRWRAAEGVFGNLPDLGPLRIHSYRVIVSRRPRFAVTLAGAFLGAGSHVVIDAFTHTGRWGSNLLGLNTVLFSVPVSGEVTTARLIQYLGHSVGSLIGIALFLYIGSNRLLERWYGRQAVESARAFRLALRSRLIFWGVSAVIFLGSAVVLIGAALGRPVFSLFVAGTAGLLTAGCLHSTSGRAVSPVSLS